MASPHAVCPCGHPWFELQAFVTSSERGLGACQVDASGAIHLVSGIWVCANCETPLEIEEEKVYPKLALVRG